MAPTLRAGLFHARLIIFFIIAGQAGFLHKYF
jgi:hypothetical protein